MLSVLKNTAFLIWLIGALALVSITATVLAVQSAATVAQLSSQAAANAIRHRKEINRAVAKAKAKARLQRMMTMVPVAGLAAGAYFEEQEYQEWLSINPDGSRSLYLCHVAELASEVFEEFLVEMPDLLRPSNDIAASFLPECGEQ